MSICVAVAVPDGIALSADTQTTWNRTILKVKEKGSQREVELANPIVVPIGWSKMARKLFKMTFQENTFTFCCAGAASINQKTIYSILKSLEKNYTGDGSYGSIETHCVEGLKTELKRQYKTEDLSSAPLNVVQLIVAGFHNNDVSSPILEVSYIYSGKLNVKGKKESSGLFKSWKNSEKGTFGCCWIGEGRFIGHLVNHQNKDLPQIQGQYHMMTLEDAKDYAKFLVEYTCDFQRFAVMVPTCGRPIVTAKLTPENYEEVII